MTFGSLFSGIGGMDLGLERAGFQCKWQIENDEYCQKILTKHWPTVPKHKDITQVSPQALEYVDLMAGGFPCQDLSVAGKRAGLKEGTRSGLWFEYLRLLRALRPRFVLVENVPGLLTHHALGRVLGDLAECGYDAEWQVLSGAQFGAPHLRKRVWIVAYAMPTEQWGNQWQSQIEKDAVSDPKSSGCQRGNSAKISQRCDSPGVFPQSFRTSPSGFWEKRKAEPTICGVDDGIRGRVDRLRGLGNACVPQVVEWIGRQIMTVAGPTDTTRRTPTEERDE